LFGGAAGSVVVAVAPCAFAAVATAASAVNAVVRASVVGAVPGAGGCAAAACAGLDAVDGEVSAAAVSGFVLLLPQASRPAVVVAAVATFWFAAAVATAMACLTVSFMPCAAAAFAIALPVPLVTVLDLELLFATIPAVTVPVAVGLKLAGCCAFVAWLEGKSELPVVPVEPPVGADVCCAACGEDAGWGAAAGAGLGGAAVLASRKATNGCVSVSWLGVDACICDGGVIKAAADGSGAILDILDTRKLPEKT
jgi:hypothetical protein